MKNISIAVFDDILENIESGNSEKVKIIKTNVLKNLQNNPSDKLVKELLLVCRENLDNRKNVVKVSFLKRLIG